MHNLVHQHTPTLNKCVLLLEQHIMNALANTYAQAWSDNGYRRGNKYDMTIIPNNPDCGDSREYSF